MANVLEFFQSLINKDTLVGVAIGTILGKILEHWLAGKAKKRDFLLAEQSDARSSVRKVQSEAIEKLTGLMNEWKSAFEQIKQFHDRPQSTIEIMQAHSYAVLASNLDVVARQLAKVVESHTVTFDSKMYKKLKNYAEELQNISHAFTTSLTEFDYTGSMGDQPNFMKKAKSAFEQLLGDAKRTAFTNHTDLTEMFRRIKGVGEG